MALRALPGPRAHLAYRFHFQSFFHSSRFGVNLPIVTINTNGVPIVDKTTEVPGTITITSANAQTSYLPNASDSDNTATFHVHGNSTAKMPKLPYHVKLNTSLDLLNTMGLQCPYVTNGAAKPLATRARALSCWRITTTRRCCATGLPRLSPTPSRSGTDI